jgi:hypothetical protein
MVFVTFIFTKIIIIFIDNSLISRYTQNMFRTRSEKWNVEKIGGLIMSWRYPELFKSTFTGTGGLTIFPETDLYKKAQIGKIDDSTELERIIELKTFLEHLK